MIAVEARGRLGNQMFQFAFALAASQRLGTDFVMAEDLLRRWFRLEERSGFGQRVARSVRFRIARRIAPLQPVTVSNDSGAEPEEVLATLIDHADYNGFFQSERYFIDVSDRVRTAFAPHPRQERVFRSKYASLLRVPYVCCHVRRGDYLSFRGGVALPVSYYRSALSELREGSDTPVVFIGDDLQSFASEFRGRNVAFEQNCEIVDLQLLAHASAVVASNSSFAWWGAWLNAGEGVRVVAPRYWLGFREESEWPLHVIPSRWIQLPVLHERSADG